MCELDGRRIETVPQTDWQSERNERTAKIVEAINRDIAAGRFDFSGAICFWLSQLQERGQLRVGKLRLPNDIRHALFLIGDRVFVTAERDVYSVHHDRRIPNKLIYSHPRT